MPNFKYRARNQGGSMAVGVIAAQSEGEAVAQLRNQNLTVLEVAAESSKRSFSLKKLFKPRARVNLDSMVLFTRQLSTMINAGIPILEALEVLHEQVADKGFKAVINDIVERVRTGSDLSDALGAHPKVFSDIYVNMIRAGEASGQLDIILIRLAEYFEATAYLKREVKAAMTYPVISLVMVFGITVFLMVGIVPKFKEIFDTLGVPLNVLTRTILATSLFMRENILLGFGMIIAFFAALYAYSKTRWGSYQIDWLKLNVPVFGTLFSKVALSRFSRTFSTLLKSGVPMLGALDIVAGTAGNRIISEVVLAAKDRVRQGENLAEPLSESKAFPPMVVKMVGIGEKSGALEALLEKISEFYDQQVSAAVKSLTSMIEPIMIAIMGILVGTIVLSVFLPIIQIQQALTKSAGGQ
ncbi:MAG: type II secretion system F family protein [Planctomycetota bacterium]|jgi:type IV pilus assembly protein PilC